MGPSPRARARPREGRALGGGAAPAGVLLAAIGLVALAPSAWAEERCRVLCAPELKIEPTFTIENLFGGARIATADGAGGVVVEREGRALEPEIVIALDVPTALPRLGLTLEAIWAPFATTEENPFTGETAEELGRASIRDNVLELEIELNVTLLEPEQTGGWIDMHFDVVDQLSPAERPGAASVYTHKLDFELDTAFLLFQRLPEGHWLRRVELETSLDYLATGLPRAGDRLGDERFVDDASPWSLSIVIVFPLAPWGS